MLALRLRPFRPGLVDFGLLDGLLRDFDRLGVPFAAPSYDLIKLGKDDYRLTVPVDGYAASDLELSVDDTTLTISGKAPQTGVDGTYLHRGIAAGSFVRRFALADQVEVTGASLDKGLLIVDFVRRLPAAAEPRRIPIGSAAPKSAATPIAAKALDVIGSVRRSLTDFLSSLRR